MKSNISHVIFDVDGLLLDTEVVYSEVSTLILGAYGRKLTYEIKRKVMGRKPHDAASILVRELELSCTPDEWMAQCHEHLTEARWNAVSCLPGAERLVLHLADCNIPMAAATGCRSNELSQKMKNHPNIWKNISHAVASGDDPMITHGKPAPDIFLAASARFTNPPESNQSVLVFEDSPLGVEAAISAGMHVVWVPAKDEPPGDAPDNIPQSHWNRVTRLDSLLDFNPSAFGIPPFIF